MSELVRVKEKIQVTLPVTLRKAAKARPGIVAFLNERRGAARTRDDIDAQVDAERAAWDK